MRIGLPVEKTWQNRMSVLVNSMRSFAQECGAYCWEFYKKFGEDAIPVIQKVCGEHGVRYGEQLKKVMKGPGLKNAGLAEIEFHKIIGYPTEGENRFEVVEVSDDKLHFKWYSGCWIGLDNIGTDKLCYATGETDIARYRTAAGVEVEIEVLKSRAMGDECCECVFRVKK